jgi:hypothetical protein
MPRYLCAVVFVGSSWSESIAGCPQQPRRRMPKDDELIDVRWLSPTARLSAVSGLGWALIACFIGYRALGYRIVGGIIVAPLIGVLIGHLSSHFREGAIQLSLVGVKSCLPAPYS